MGTVETGTNANASPNISLPLHRKRAGTGTARSNPATDPTASAQDVKDSYLHRSKPEFTVKQLKLFQSVNLQTVEILFPRFTAIPN